MDIFEVKLIEVPDLFKVSIITGTSIIVNSDNTYNAIAYNGQTFVIPDTPWVDSDGTPMTSPATTPIVCSAPVGCDVENSDGTYDVHVNNGDTLVLPDITVTKNDGSTYSYPAAKDLTETKSASIYTLFPTTYDMNYSHVVTAKEAGVFTTETLVNVATVEYKVNAVVKTLPITLVAGDVLLRTITQTNAALDSSVEIYY